MSGRAEPPTSHSASTYLGNQLSCLVSAATGLESGSIDAYIWDLSVSSRLPFSQVHAEKLWWWLQRLCFQFSKNDSRPLKELIEHKTWVFFFTLSGMQNSMDYYCIFYHGVSSLPPTPVIKTRRRQEETGFNKPVPTAARILAETRSTWKLIRTLWGWWRLRTHLLQKSYQVPWVPG